MNVGVGSRMIPILIYKENCMEHLHGFVRIHSSSDLRDPSQVAIEEFAQTGVVFHGAASAATTDVEFKLRNTKCILHINQHQPDFGRISRSTLKVVLMRPFTRLGC